MKREFKQVIKMTYYVQEALQDNPFIEFYNWGISCGVISPIHIQFFHKKEQKEGEILCLLLLRFALLRCSDEILVYKLTVKDDIFNQNQI